MATDDSYFILQVDTGAISAAIEAKQGLGEDGLEEAFDVSSYKMINFRNQSAEAEFGFTYDYKFYSGIG